jgi:hypothetical protein
MGDTQTDREEYLAKLRHMNAETEKFVAEQRKLIEEAGKFGQERISVVLSAGAAILAARAALGGIAIKLLGG